MFNEINIHLFVYIFVQIYRHYEITDKTKNALIKEVTLKIYVM